ncbi:MAG: hypothetical protein ACLSAH_03160 [Bilophila wadsworthia]
MNRSCSVRRCRTKKQPLQRRSDAGRTAGQSAGTFVGRTGIEPQAEVINLTEPVRKPTPAQPAEKDAPIPDLFGDARPAPQPGPRSLLDEAACLAPCGQGSRPTASTNELAIDDIVELGVPVAPVIQPATEKDTALPEPQEAPLPPVLPAGDGEAAAQEQPGPGIPETPEQEPALPTKDGQKGPLQDAEQESEASDEAIRALLTELDEALERAIRANNRATRRWSAKPPPISDVWRNLRSARAGRSGPLP